MVEFLRSWYFAGFSVRPVNFDFTNILAISWHYAALFGSFKHARRDVTPMCTSQSERWCVLPRSLIGCLCIVWQMENALFVPFQVRVSLSQKHSVTTPQSQSEHVHRLTGAAASLSLMQPLLPHQPALTAFIRVQKSRRCVTFHLVVSLLSFARWSWSWTARLAG